MAKKREKPPTPAPPSGITTDRFARLYRLLQFLGKGGQTRAALVRRLRTDIRGFYRDLELLRAAGIQISLNGNRYQLEGELEASLLQLPFPDARLTYGDVVRLSKGRTAAHSRLRDRIDEMMP
jgi:hypothetical protein